MPGPLPPSADEDAVGRRVVVASYRSVVEAHLARARLESDGIEVALVGEHTAHLLGVQNVELLVATEEQERAQAILAAPAGPAGSADFVTDDLDAPRCRQCGCLRLEPERRLLPLPGRAPRLRCTRCGARDAVVAG